MTTFGQSYKPILYSATDADYKDMTPNSIHLLFKGFVSVEFLDSIIMLIGQRLEQVEPSVTVRKKVYGVMVECLQNLCKHTDNPIEGLNNSHYDPNGTLFAIDSDKNGYCLVTGNFIRNERIVKLQDTLNHLNSLDKTLLKELYTQVIRNKTFSDKGGAGLGFIDMARKADQKLNYSFEEIDSQFSFFTFQTFVNKV